MSPRLRILVCFVFGMYVALILHPVFAGEIEEVEPEMEIPTCLSPYSVVFGIWKSAKTNPYCEADRLDEDGKHQEAAEMRCSVRYYRKLYGKDCIKRVLVVPKSEYEIESDPAYIEQREELETVRVELATVQTQQAIYLERQAEAIEKMEEVLEEVPASNRSFSQADVDHVRGILRGDYRREDEDGGK